MDVRIVTLSGAKDIDAGVDFVRNRVLPLLGEQKGYRGLTAGADREGGVLGVLTLWETAEDREASGATLAPTRQEAADIIGGDLTVENFELLASEVGDSPPRPGSALLVTRVHMDPARIDDNIGFFTSEVVPRITATPGFQALRNMMNRETGDGVVGTVWADEGSRKQALDDAMSRREEATSRGVTFGDVSLREIVLVDMK